MIYLLHMICILILCNISAVILVQHHLTILSPVSSIFR